MAYNNNNNNGNQPEKRTKKSGAKSGVGKNKEMYVQGWRASGGVITKIIATPQKNLVTVDKSTGEVTKKNYPDGILRKTKEGKEYLQMVCSITVGLAAPVLHTGFWHQNTGKLRIPAINMVAATKAPNGGYFGTSVRKAGNYKNGK